MENINKGMLLVSEPFLGDPEFERSVILIVEKNESGTIGFVLNYELEVMVGEVLEAVSFDKCLYKGGPVCLDSLFFVYKSEIPLKKSLIVSDGYYWGGDIEELTERIIDGSIDYNSIRFFVGYSGWEPGQLEMELKHKAWNVLNYELDIIFEKNPENMWRILMKSMGGKYAMMADSPIDPQLN